MIRTHDFDALRAVLRGNESPQAVPGDPTGAIFTVPAASPLFVENHFPATFPAPAPARMDRGEETGLFGPLMLAANLPLCPELRQFRHRFFSALAGCRQTGDSG